MSAHKKVVFFQIRGENPAVEKANNLSQSPTKFEENEGIKDKGENCWERKEDLDENNEKSEKIENQSGSTNKQNTEKNKKIFFTFRDKIENFENKSETRGGNNEEKNVGLNGSQENQGESQVNKDSLDMEIEEMEEDKMLEDFEKYLD